MAQRVSMRQIAKLAGVSHMTVSLALRNDPSIAEATRARIRDIADEHGYRPDPAISSVMSRLRFGKDSGHVLAYVTQFGEFDWHKHPVHGATFRSAAGAAKKYGYRLEVFEMGRGGLSPRRLRQILYTRAICGLLVNASPDRIGHLSFDLNPFSVVQMGTGIVRPLMHRVTTNAAHNLRTAMRALRRAGAKKIGMVMNRIVDSRNEHTWAGTLAVYHQGLPVKQRIPAFMPDHLDFPGFKKWFLKHRPDAIACIESRMLEWVAALGLRCPDDVQVVALDRHAQDAGFAGINQNHESVGRMALELLLGQMHINETGVPEVPRTTLIDGIWEDGPSCLFTGTAGSPAARHPTP